MFMGIILLLSILTATITAKNEQRTACLMKPPWVAMQIPEKGFVWLEGQEFQGDCDTVAADKWERSPSKTFDLFVYVDGPSGSGRYWVVTVGVASKHEKNPSRGFCFMTSTVGWRTLQQYKKLPLPWIKDLDGDKRPELIIWDSFPMSEQASLAEYGLIAWVYQVDVRGRLTIDWRLSRKMAREIATTYRKPLKQDYAWLHQEFRNQIAQALETFSKEACSTGTERSR